MISPPTLFHRDALRPSLPTSMSLSGDGATPASVASHVTRSHSLAALVCPAVLKEVKGMSLPLPPLAPAAPPATFLTAATKRYKTLHVQLGASRLAHRRARTRWTVWPEPAVLERREGNVKRSKPRIPCRPGEQKGARRSMAARASAGPTTGPVSPCVSSLSGVVCQLRFLPTQALPGVAPSRPEPGTVTDTPGRNPPILSLSP